jgi:hypothetical protein
MLDTAKTTTRQWLAKNKVLISAVCITVIVAALALDSWQFLNRDKDRFVNARAFFSTDDGKSYFTASGDLLPPFEYSGGTAVRAFVFTADGGKTNFVGYLQRLTPTGKERMAALREKAKLSPSVPSLDAVLMSNTEVKRPADAEWVKQSDVQRSQKIMSVMRPGNSNQEADIINP